jgi:hypothetical protein
VGHGPHRTFALASTGATVSVSSTGGNTTLTVSIADVEIVVW